MEGKNTTQIEELVEKGVDFEVHSKPKDPRATLIDFYQFATEHVDSIPWRKLEAAGWINEGRDISALAPLVESFHDSGQKKSLFRKSKTANDFLVCFWLARVESKAKEAFLQSPQMTFDIERFNQDALYEISRLSSNVNAIGNLKNTLAEYGVILVYELAIPGIKSDGVVTKLANGLPVVGLSLRYSRLDYFWFTLLHELSHIVLHYEKIDSPIIEDLESHDQDLLEKQADMLARNTFIPRKDWYRCPPKYDKSEVSIIEFAEKMGIHPAIVAGRLQKETDQYDRYRKIVDEINIMDFIEE